MADAREQGPSGHAPINPGPGTHGASHPGPGEVRPVKVDMVQGPPPGPAHRPAARRATASGAGMIASAVLALVFGGAGAWAYERFLSQPAAEGASAAQATQGQDPGARKDPAGMEDRIKDLADRYNDLADQYKQLQARLESVSKAAPAPDLAPIEQKVAQVDRLSHEVDAMGKRIEPLSQRFDQYENRIKELDRKLEELRQQGIAARGPTPSGRDRQVTLTRADRPAPSNEAEEPAPATTGNPPATAAAADHRPSPSGDGGASAVQGFGSGVSLFNEKRYGDAYAAFRTLLQSQPDDARVWYYAALSYGLTTGEWEGTTKTMVEEGVAREKAGKPAKAEIDSTFAGLTRETGKDWLAFYRRRAG